MVVEWADSTVVGKVEYSVDSWDDEMAESMVELKVGLMDARVAAG